MMLTDVCVGSGRAETEGMVEYVSILRHGQGGNAFMVGLVGLMGVTGREW